MATLVLSTVGSVLGGAVGGPVGGAIGRVLGSAVGAFVDGALAGRDSPRFVEGPRLKDLDGLASTEGAPIPRVYGRARIGGQLIWATRFEEVANTTVERSGARGGKGGLGTSGGQKTVRTTYAYFANLAIGLCEGPVGFVRRVWADGRELDLTTLTMRLHRGTEDQPPDPLIVAKEGVENAPAYRGLAYAVFERLPLEPFGNRVPQFSFEVVRPVEGLASMVRAVCLIPGAGEFAYETAPVVQAFGFGVSQPENRHQLQADADVAASLDALTALCPNLNSVSLVASWFGDDLRAGHCTVAPRAESAVKVANAEWSAAGLTRATARAVSQAGGAPAYGGTPSDLSVVRLIRELKDRGLKVMLYPFVMMDVPVGNGLPDPWTGTLSQPPYPWRGRIVCDPAPGRPGTIDGTAAAAAQVAAFFGTAAPADFSAAGEAVAYAGPDEWSFRRHVLHYAHLALAAGGVDGFVIGSELVGLTRVRSTPGAYPAVTQLCELAVDVRAVLGAATKITYAADWTEYGAHVLGGGGEVRFPLDPLWAHPAVDAVGIDFYPPLADWRDGPDHADLVEARSAYDLDYLRARVASGEAFDWFYPSDADQRAQARVPIIDGAYGKPWVFRAKDLMGWWSSPHVERAGGVETAATVWVPHGKPIWLTETGVPAVDKGANAPNVFPDPKSSENAVPLFSRGTRDDLIQARALEAILSRFDPALPGHPAGANPVSPVYGGPMVDPEHVFVWAWDARPFPAFPDFDLVWADAANWQTGHWITGRLEGLALDRLVAAVLADFDLEAPAELAVDGFLDGYVIDRPMSAREALEPLARLYGIDAVARAGAFAFRGRGGRAATAIAADDLVTSGRDPVLRLVRAQETELPRQIELGFTDAEADYRRAAVASRRLAGMSRRETRADAAVVTRRPQAQRLADAWLQDLWAGRETAEFALARRHLAIEAGDMLWLPTDAGPRLHRVVRVADGLSRSISTRAAEPSMFDAPAGEMTRLPRRPPPLAGAPEPVVLDLPVARGEPTVLQYLAVAADPWPGAVAVWRAGETGFAFDRAIDLPAAIGRTLTPLPPGPLWRWDTTSVVDVVLARGTIASVGDEEALGGANLFAVRGGDGRWEIISAARAELIAEKTFRLSRLLRGLAGSEPEAARTLAPDATILRLDEAVTPLTEALADLGVARRYRVGPADRDHADPSYAEVAATATGDTLRPLAPVHVRARRDADGVHVTWIRRARRDADAWEPVEVPLAEEAERYEVDVLDGAAVKRTLTSAAPEALYPAAQELADFGSPRATLSLRVAQMSVAVGRGFERIVTVTID
ncbi:MAG TPA: glycoside hydrolase/phage tail family protein [Beijerinckiaceae bacterium]|jgi:hypothetical protein